MTANSIPFSLTLTACAAANQGCEFPHCIPWVFQFFQLSFHATAALRRRPPPSSALVSSELTLARMPPDRRWGAFEMCEELHRKITSPDFSIQVESQHAKQQVWLRLESTWSTNESEGLAHRISESLAQSKNRFVLDFNKLCWDPATDLKPLREKLADYLSPSAWCCPNCRRPIPNCCWWPHVSPLPKLKCSDGIQLRRSPLARRHGKQRHVPD